MKKWKNHSEIVVVFANKYFKMWISGLRGRCLTRKIPSSKTSWDCHFNLSENWGYYIKDAVRCSKEIGKMPCPVQDGEGGEGCNVYHSKSNPTTINKWNGQSDTFMVEIWQMLRPNSIYQLHAPCTTAVCSEWDRERERERRYWGGGGMNCKCSYIV